MKLSEYKNEDALDLLADILEPTARILGDKDLAKAVQRKATKIEAIKIAIKNHKEDVIEILARLDGKSVSEYTCNPVSLLKDVLDLLNDKDLTDFFTSQQQMMEKESSTSAMENTKASAK